MAWIALGIVYLVWGSTYFAIAIVVQTLPPLLTAGVRFLIAGLVLAAWVAALIVASVPLWIVLLRLAARDRVGRDVSIGVTVGIVGVAVLVVPSGVSGQQMLAASVLLLVFGPITGERIDPSTVSTSSLVALGYLAVFGSLVAFSAYTWLLGVPGHALPERAGDADDAPGRR